MSQDNKNEFLELMALWRNKGLTPLVSVIGFSLSLLEEEWGKLNEEQRQSLELILHSGIRAADCWHAAADYVHLRYETLQEEYRVTGINEVIDNALSHLDKLTVIENIKTDIPDNLPTVKAYKQLDRLFIYLLDAPPLRHYIMDNPLTITVRLNDSKSIKVQIQTERKLSPDIALKSSGFFHPGTFPSVAQLIVKKHGGKLHVCTI